MLLDEEKKYLFDIKTSIKSIEDNLGEKREFEVYQSNKMPRRAVEREFEIIGEAMIRLDKIDNEIIWGTIIRHLSVLKNEVADLLA